MQRMNKKTKWAVINVFVLIAVVCVTIICYEFLTQTRASVIGTSFDDSPSPVVTTTITASPIEPPVSDISTDIDVPSIDDALFSDKELSDEVGLRGDVHRKDMLALIVTFDNLTLRPGMTLKDITESSHWYATNGDDLLAPGDAAYAVLDNDFWSADEIRLTDRYESNGNVTMWVHNYSDKPTALQDCVIYKYSLNFYNSLRNFSERPVLTYRSNYHFGYTGLLPFSDRTETAAFNNESYTRYIYGSIDECQVILDMGNDGLFGITVSYNEFYGPNFQGGDSNG